MAKGSMLDADAEIVLTELAQTPLKAAQIYRFLQDNGYFAKWTPDPRTVQRKVRAARGRDAGTRWCFAEADPEDARLVLPVLAALLEKTQGRVWLTKDTADWIVRLKTAAPTLPDDYSTYIYARTYQRDGEKVLWLDRFLAFRPWESNDAYARYQKVEAEVAASGFERLLGLSPPPEPIYVPESPEEAAANWEREEAELQNGGRS
jgi:hypothetical protein